MPPPKSSARSGAKKSRDKTKKPDSSGISAKDLKEMQKALAEAKRNGVLPANFALDLSGMLAAARKNLPRPGVIQQSVSDKPFTLPASKKAVLLGAFIEPALDNIPLLSQMLAARGYEVEPDHRLSLDALRNLPGRDIGVLYLATHATSTGYFGLGTDDDFIGRTVKAKERREKDVKKGKGFVESMTYTVMGVGPGGTREPSGTAEGYSARLEFFNEYWRGKKIFSKDSLVYISACDVDDPHFINLLIECGAGTILAWTSEVPVDLATRTANYVFDRLLGTNVQVPEFYPEKFPQRPWTWSEIAVNMKLHKTPAASSLGGPYDNRGFTFNPTPIANLAVHYGHSAGPFLVPSIFFFQVDEFKEQLSLHGWFGPDPGPRATVTIYDSLAKNANGRTLQIKKGNWDVKRGTITCELPADGGITSGYIVVAVDGRRSNCLPLTEWKGEIVATAQGDQDLQEEGRINFRLRMDTHACRLNFMMPLTNDSYHPVNMNAIAHATVSSSCKSYASGSAHYDPPEQGLSAQSVSGNVSAQPASSEKDGQLRIGKDLFNVALFITKIIDVRFNQTFDINLRATVTNPQYCAGQMLTWSKTKPRKPPVTEDLPALSWLSAFGDLVDFKGQKSCLLPALNLSKEVNVGPWKTATLIMTSKVLFAPDPRKGEDYLPVMK